MSKSKNKGFTLLEVMLAVAVLSLGLVMVVRSFATSLRAIKISHNFLVANLLLEERIWHKLEEERRTGGIIPDEEQGEFAPPFEDFGYKISFEKQEDLPSLYKSTFEVFWQQRKSEWGTACVTYLRRKEE